MTLISRGSACGDRTGELGSEKVDAPTQSPAVIAGLRIIATLSWLRYVTATNAGLWLPARDPICRKCHR